MSSRFDHCMLNCILGADERLLGQRIEFSWLNDEKHFHDCDVLLLRSSLV